jgi:hypothetical protein
MAETGNREQGTGIREQNKSQGRRPSENRKLKNRELKIEN